MSKLLRWKLVIGIICVLLILTPGKMVWAGQSFQTVPTTPPNPTKAPATQAAPAPATATAIHKQPEGPKNDPTEVIVPPSPTAQPTTQPTALPTQTLVVVDSINEPTPSPIVTTKEAATRIPEARVTAANAGSGISQATFANPIKDAPSAQKSSFAFWPVVLLFAAGIGAVIVVVKKFLFR